MEVRLNFLLFTHFIETKVYIYIMGKGNYVTWSCFKLVLTLVLCSRALLTIT